MTTPEIAGVMAAAMGFEDRRRELASESPGLGYQLQLPQPYADAGQGSPPVVGEGYDTVAEIAAAMHKSYGPARPEYGPAEVAGIGHPLGIAQAARRSVTNLGDGGLLWDARPDGRAAYTVVSPPAAKPGLLARLAARLRRR